MGEVVDQRPVGEGRATLAALFAGFLKIGLMGLGGVGPVARHIIVTERGWLDDRYRGVSGALACVIALMAVPLASLLGLAITAATMLVTYGSKLNPLVPMAAGTVVYLALWRAGLA